MTLFNRDSGPAPLDSFPLLRIEDLPNNITLLNPSYRHTLIHTQSTYSMQTNEVNEKVKWTCDLFLIWQHVIGNMKLLFSCYKDEPFQIWNFLYGLKLGKWFNYLWNLGMSVVCWCNQESLVTAYRTLPLRRGRLCLYIAFLSQSLLFCFLLVILYASFYFTLCETSLSQSLSQFICSPNVTLCFPSTLHTLHL